MYVGMEIVRGNEQVWYGVTCKLVDTVPYRCVDALIKWLHRQARCQKHLGLSRLRDARKITSTAQTYWDITWAQTPRAFGSCFSPSKCQGSFDSAGGHAAKGPISIHRQSFTAKRTAWRTNTFRPHLCGASWLRGSVSDLQARDGKLESPVGLN